EDQSEFFFLFNQKLVDVDRSVSIDIKNESIEKILAKLFEHTNVSYLVKDRQIILTTASPESVITEQQKSISGKVTDSSGSPLPGVSVVVKGTTSGTITDANGNYSMTGIPENATLQFSFVGMTGQEVPVSGKTIINIKMTEETVGIEEVVAVGYGTQKKANVTGAVSAVKMDEVLGDRPVTSLGAILQGSVPGFTASSSVIPGGGNSFNIRGLESINGGSPLVLVDNVVFNDLYLINPEDIESVSVLKDASSAAIYGARASFGVILITTKKGKRNEKLSINYNNNFAVSTVDNLPKLASPTDMINTLQDGGYSSIWSGQNIANYSGLLQDYSTNPEKYPLGWTEVNGTKYFLKPTDVMGEMFEASWKQTHDISVQGGSEKINYRISLGYTDENGILITRKDAFTKTNISSFVSGDIASWLTTSLDIKYNSGEKLYPFIDGSSELGIWKVNLPSYHPDGTLPYGTDGAEYPVMTPANIIKMTDISTTRSDNSRIFSRSVLKPLKGLEAILEYSFQMDLTDYQAYANYFKVHQGLAESIKPSTSTNPFTTSRASRKYSTINAYATYNRTFGTSHNISLISGYNQEYNDYRYLFSEACNMISNDLPSLSGTNGATPPTTYDNYDQYALRGGFFRANYNYAQKYFVEVNGRYDLSSKFPKEYRSGFFPSVSAAWNLANESFMKGAD
ncbi:MAG: SusC/RagA family TonB-linked outer membrane protein, partial [Prolixibacteraceae bacterium]|nr:SusC/RagA family TonB-linked outer membrane protein [Prolixibacteraceae bacterium]